MFNEKPLKDASIAEICEELRRRGTMPSVWSGDDAECFVEDDIELAVLSDDEKSGIQNEFISVVWRDLENRLGETGNEFLGAKWDELRDEIVASARGMAPASGKI